MSLLPDKHGCSDGVHPSCLGEPSPVRPRLAVYIRATCYGSLVGEEGRERAELPRKIDVRDWAKQQATGVGGVESIADTVFHLLAGSASGRLREVSEGSGGVVMVGKARGAARAVVGVAAAGDEHGAGPHVPVGPGDEDGGECSLLAVRYHARGTGTRSQRSPGRGL